MKVLWVSDSPEMQQVGQSRVGREICYRLNDAGIDIEVAGYIPPGEIEKSNPIDSFPVHDCHRYETEELLVIIDKVKPGMIIFSHDPFMYKCIVSVREKYGDDIIIIGYFTIDGEPVSHVFKDIFSACDHVVCPSYYGQCVVKERFFDIPTTVIPYGINSDLYCCDDKQAKKEELSGVITFGREKMDFKNKVVYLYVGNNQGRKNVGVARDAFKRFADQRPGEVLFILAMKSSIVPHGDMSYIGYYDIAEFDHPCIRVTGQMLHDNVIASLYQVSDFLLHPTIGEGFGLTLLEAMASKCIPITTNFAASTDFCNESNSIMLDDYAITRGDFDVKRAFVSEGCVLEALEKSLELHSDVDQKTKMNSIGRETAEYYTWEKAAEGFINVMGLVSRRKKMSNRYLPVVRV